MPEKDIAKLEAEEMEAAIKASLELEEERKALEEKEKKLLDV